MLTLNKSILKTIKIIFLACVFSFGMKLQAISAEETIFIAGNHPPLYKDIIDEYRKFADKKVEEFRKHVANNNEISERYYKLSSTLRDSHGISREKVTKLHKEKSEKLKEEELNLVSLLSNAFNDDKELLEKFRTGNKTLDIAIANYKAKEREFEKKIDNANIIENMALIANPDNPQNNPLIREMKKLTKTFEESGIHPDPWVRYGITMQAIAENKAERKTFKQLTEYYEANYTLSIIKEQSINKMREIRDSVK